MNANQYNLTVAVHGSEVQGSAVKNLSLLKKNKPKTRFKFLIFQPLNHRTLNFEPRANGYNLMEAISSEEVILQAYQWVCKQREHYPHNSDIWDLRWRWDRIKTTLQEHLLAGTYKLGSTTIIEKEDRKLELWCSLDVLVLKATSIVLAKYLTPHLSKKCHHISGNSGRKEAVRAVIRNLKGYTFVFRTDVKKYYASIDHTILLSMLEKYIKDNRVLDLLRAYMQQVVYDRGLYKEGSKGVIC